MIKFSKLYAKAGYFPASNFGMENDGQSLLSKALSILEICLINVK